MKRMKKRKSKHARQILSAPAMYVLRIGLPIIVAELFAFLVFFRQDLQKDATYALHRYPPMLEHIMMGLTLLVIGAFLFDYIAKRNRSIMR